MGTFRLFWKIVALSTGLTVLAAAVMVAGLASWERRAAEQRLEQRLQQSAALLGASLSAVGESPSPAPFDGLVRRAEQQTGQHVTLAEGDGRVLADSRDDPTSMPNVFRHNPEFITARSTGLGSTVDPGTRTLYSAVRVDNPSSPVAYVRLGASLDEVDAEVSRFRHTLLLSAVVVSLLALGLAFLLAYRVTRPLKVLTRAIASGEIARLPESDGRDEVGALAEAFRTMNRDQLARIGELQQQGRQLEENTRLLSTVLGGMIEGVVAVDHSERILFANPAARVMLDLSGLDAVGRPVWEVIRTPKIHEVVQAALSGGDNAPVEMELPRLQTIVALMASRLPGTPCPGAVLVMHDVTELRRLENLRREFVSNVSHELKTPLTSIQAWTETLLDGAVDNPQHNRTFLQRIAEQADRLHMLILDLLRLARIESGKDVFEVVAVPVDKVAYACVDGHSAIAGAKGVTLRITQPSPSMRVQADAEGLRTILDNLVDNAIKYTPSGGSVTVRWRPDGREGLIEVEDTGVGIPSDHLVRIFERFYRVDKARSREVGGTGLGLAIVKHLTQVFEGRVDVQSRPGAGSTFSVRLPLVK